MSQDPIRWKDDAEASPAVRELLADVDVVPPMRSEDEAAIRAAIVAAAAGPVMPPSAPAAKSAGLAPSVYVLPGLATLAAVGVVAFLWAGASTPGDAERTVPGGPAATTPADRAVPSGAAPDPEVAPTSGSSADAAPAPSAAAPTSPVTTTGHATSARPSQSAARPEDGGVVESVLVDRARANVESSPGEALRLLDEHERRFPGGQLVSEREYLAIRVLRRLGRTDDARRRAQAYLRRFPSSPYVAAVNALLTELGDR